MPNTQRGKPDGYGTMYKKDGSVFVGCFQEGKASGPGRYIFKDGSYYHGTFNNNVANSEQAQYVCKSLRYEGGIKKNEFHGKGK